MWRRGDEATVTCIACGEEIDRGDAREYDKHGDRWSRRDKEFEHLCKSCHRELCHLPRGDLEATLVRIDTAAVSERRFVERYYEVLDRTAESDRDVRDP